MALKRGSNLKYKTDQIQGMSLVEVVLALAIFSAMTSLVLSSQWSVVEISRNNFKLILAHNISVLGLIDRVLNSLNSGIAADGTGPGIEGGIHHAIKVKPFSVCEIEVESVSSWLTEWQSTSTLNFSFLQSDTVLAEKYGLDCGGHPRKFYNDGFNLERTVEVESPVNALDIFGNSIYVSLKTSTPEDADIIVVDTSGGDIIDSVDTGEIVNKIDFADGHLYLAQNSSTTQLAIFEVNNPSLSLVATSSLPGVAGARPGAVSIFYFDSKVYVGTKRTAGREFHIFNVSSPDQPEWLGSLEINHNVNDIQVKDGFAFLATSGNVRDMIVLDVREPSNITQVETIDLPGNEDGRAVYVSGNNIYLGRHKGTSPGHDELFVFEFIKNDDGDLEEIVTLDSAPTRADVTDIVVSAGTMFATTENSESELQIFELNESGELVPVGEVDFSAYANAVDVEDSRYVISTGNTMHFFAQE